MVVQEEDGAEGEEVDEDVGEAARPHLSSHSSRSLGWKGAEMRVKPSPCGTWCARSAEGRPWRRSAEAAASLHATAAALRGGRGPWEASGGVEAEAEAEAALDQRRSTTAPPEPITSDRTIMPPPPSMPPP